MYFFTPRIHSPKERFIFNYGINQLLFTAITWMTHITEKLSSMFKQSTFSISEEVYYYCQVENYPQDKHKHFMVSSDGDEITVVTKNPDLLEDLIEKNENEWLMISLNLHTPFMKGTLFNVSKVIYESDSSILIVSTYSKDILFIKRDDKSKVIEALENIGFRYVEHKP